MRQPKITPCLWFDGRAEEAARFYVSVFPRSKLGTITRWGEAGGPEKAGKVLTVDFTLAGQPFWALDGGPEYKFNEAISLTVNCRDQKEVDAVWRKLTAGGGREVQCGWLKDKYGVSWQIVPLELTRMIRTKDPAARDRVMRAFFPMKKFDLAALRRAYKAKPRVK